MGARLRCRIERDREATRLDVAGSLDRGNEIDLVRAFWRAADRPGREVVVDLSRVTYFDSIALTTVLGLERIAERQRGCAVDVRGIETAAWSLTGLG